MKTINLEEFLENLQEQKLDRYYSQEMLSSKYSKLGSDKKISDKLSLQIYISPHLEQRFYERFIDGRETFWEKPNIPKRFKDLDDWTPLVKKDLHTAILNGVNKCIEDHNLAIGAYFIISRSKKIVLPLVIARTDQANIRAACFNTVLHTEMRGHDKFNLGTSIFDHEKLMVENTYSVYEKVYEDKELNISLDVISSQKTIEYSEKVIFIE